MNCCRKKIEDNPPACGQGGSCFGTAKCHVEEWTNNSDFNIVLWPINSHPEQNPNVSPNKTTVIKPGQTYSYVYYGDDSYLVIQLQVELSTGVFAYYNTLTMLLGKDSVGNFYPKPMFGGDKGAWDSTILWNYDNGASKWINSGSPADGQGYFLNHYNLTGKVPLNYIQNSSNGTSWHSGMNNDNNNIPGAFWVIDYGFSNWSVNSDKNVAEDIAVIGDSTHKPSGSRAWPLYICKGESGEKSLCGNSCNENTPGLAQNGVWMIDVKVGSKLQKGVTQADRGKVCECFYLAQRKTLFPGSSFYADGSGGGGNNIFSTEIDMFETLWKNGPQINLPDNHCWSNDDDNSINSVLPYCVSGEESFGQLCTWENIEEWTGEDYYNLTISYGAYITSENDLYIFSYFTDKDGHKRLLYCNCQGSQEFDKSLQSGPVKGSPKGVGDSQGDNLPFVPYIGAWSGTNELNSDITEYSNFYYVPVSKLGDSTPLDDEGKDGSSTFYDKVKGN